jgi:hypothetical protein
MKKSEVRELIREQVRAILKEAGQSNAKWMQDEDKLDPSDLYKGRSYFAIPINATKPQYEEVQYNGKNSEGEYDFTFGTNVTGATGLTLKYIDRTSRVWSNIGHSKPPHKPDTILVKDEEVAKMWVAGKFNGGY